MQAEAAAAGDRVGESGCAAGWVKAAAAGRVSINGDLEVRTHGTKKYRKKIKNKTSFYHFLSVLPMASPILLQTLFSHL